MRYTLLALILFLPIVAHAALVNINTADAALLDTLPGIGPAKAAAIIDYRTQNGPFVAIEDIQNVSGIGPATFANMKGQITVGGQPSPDPASLKKVQTVDTITSPPSNIEGHVEGIEAPAAPAEPAAAGAPLSQQPSRGAALLHSPWTLALLAVIVVAGGIFILL